MKLSTTQILILSIFFIGMILIPLIWGIGELFVYCLVVTILAKGYTVVAGTPNQSNKAYKELHGKCPHCKEEMKPWATTCPHCLRES